jgi:hypothetical protein
MDQTPSAEKRSAPYKVFEVNFQRITALAHNSLEAVSGLSNQVQESVQASSSALVEMTGRLHALSTAKPSDGAQGEVNSIAEELQQVHAAMAPLPPLIDQFGALLKSRSFLYSWMIVMLVTFAEAYLEDALNLLLTSGLSKASLPLPISDEMRRKWVRDILRSGRPHQWIKKLEEFGVKGYSPALPEQMRAIWERRHHIAHSAEPEVRNTIPYEFLDAAKVVATFVDTTDAFIVTSCLNN